MSSSSCRSVTKRSAGASSAAIIAAVGVAGAANAVTSANPSLITSASDNLTNWSNSHSIAAAENDYEYEYDEKLEEDEECHSGSGLGSDVLRSSFTLRSSSRSDSKAWRLNSWMRSNPQVVILMVLCLITTGMLVMWSEHLPDGHENHHALHLMSDSLQESIRKPLPVVKETKSQQSTVDRSIILPSSPTNGIAAGIPEWEGCLSDLPEGPDNRHHIVNPPAGPVTLVCCNTTKGAINIEVHPTWAPYGAKRFLDMVNDNFFSTEVPLFRALKGFIVQFGLAGDPAVHKRYRAMGNLPDDPNWLPEGPKGREINGTTRFQKGYLAYAGAGKNSRGTQLILALANNLYLGGGSPWEVPIGQVVGKESLHTLDRIYTGYGEKPSQGKIMNRGKAYIKENFPLIDFMNACKIIKENIPWRYIPPST